MEVDPISTPTRFLPSPMSFPKGSCWRRETALRSKLWHRWSENVKKPVTRFAGARGSSPLSQPFRGPFVILGGVLHRHAPCSHRFCATHPTGPKNLGKKVDRTLTHRRWVIADPTRGSPAVSRADAHLALHRGLR